MKTPALILAGALVFDLGVVVVGAQAAEAPKPSAPKADGTSLNFSKVEIDYIYIKFDTVNSRQACAHKSGKVVDVKGIPMCQLPKTAAPGGR
ncbi:hypothetical protein [Phenylobacterium sp.]|uniref:hypothetical protein n=1 Tax=Phenylobacterium sp. TaxID=1871053 RepID=UPI0030F43026